MEDLAKDTAKGWVGDYFKKSFKSVLRLPQKEPLEIAIGKTLKEFLQFVQQELEDVDVDEKVYQISPTVLKRQGCQRNPFLAAKSLSEVRNRRDIEAPAHKLLNRLKNLIKYGDYRLAIENARSSGNSEEFTRIRKIRSQAITMIAMTWRDDSETLPWLKSLAQEDEEVQKDRGDWIVQYTAVSELARGWKDDPETLSWLKFNAQKNNNGTVREAALAELAKGWKDDSDILPMLKYRAHEDSYKYVRYVAVRELARSWKDDPDTLPILKACAESDEYFVVRAAAINRLAQGWHNEPEMFEFFCDRAVNDPFDRKYKTQKNPRQIALERIIEYYPNYPRTLELLRDRAEHDPDEQVREFAKEKLKERQG